MQISNLALKRVFLALFGVLIIAGCGSDEESDTSSSGQIINRDVDEPKPDDSNMVLEDEEFSWPALCSEVDKKHFSPGSASFTEYEELSVGGTLTVGDYPVDFSSDNGGPFRYILSITGGAANSSLDMRFYFDELDILGDYHFDSSKEKRFALSLSHDSGAVMATAGSATVSEVKRTFECQDTPAPLLPALILKISVDLTVYDWVNEVDSILEGDILVPVGFGFVKLPDGVDTVPLEKGLHDVTMIPLEDELEGDFNCDSKSCRNFLDYVEGLDVFEGEL